MEKQTSLSPHMETTMGSTSLTTTTDSEGSSSSPPSNNNEDSLQGLKFGRKIYFEDGTLATPKSGSSSSGGSKKQRTERSSGGGGGEQAPRCQVAGCNVDLSDVKAYYSRHRVCAMHSKTPTVVVAGLEQRFCQQCSRFHQLPEFDQGKRSCRRRLAGHNERRRKPQPGSMMSTRFGHHSSSIYDHNSRVGSFLMDFTAYPRDGSDAWAAARTSGRPPANPTVTATGKFLQHPWQGHPENTRSDLYLQGSAGSTGYPGPGIPPGECVTGVTDSSCALSLLSNQSWDSTNRGVGTNAFLNTQGAPIAQPLANVGHVNQFPTTSWGFKENEAGSSSHEMLPDLGLGQISQPFNSHYSDELELSQHGRRQQNMELGNSRAYNSSSQQVHWSL